MSHNIGLLVTRLWNSWIIAASLRSEVVPLPSSITELTLGYTAIMMTVSLGSYSISQVSSLLIVPHQLILESPLFLFILLHLIDSCSIFRTRDYCRVWRRLNSRLSSRRGSHTAAIWSLKLLQWIWSSSWLIRPGHVKILCTTHSSPLIYCVSSWVWRCHFVRATNLLIVLGDVLQKPVFLVWLLCLFSSLLYIVLRVLYGGWGC